MTDGDFIEIQLKPGQRIKDYIMDQREAYNAQNQSYTQAGAKLSQGGIAVIEDRLNGAMHKCGHIYEILLQTESRMFSPRPSPVSATSVDTGSKPISVENSLNQLNNALLEIEAIATRILQGP